MRAAALFLLLALTAGSGGAAQRAEGTGEPAAQGPEAALRLAEEHLAAGRVEPALAALRQVLVQAPNQHDARLRLIEVLLDRQRHAEALPEIQRLLTARPDVAAHAAWLRALEAVGSPLERALAAEEAVRRHPGHLPFTWAAVEALIAVGAHEQALGYWRKLPKAEQASARGLYLLGAAHEAAGRPAEAVAAWRAARGEPRAEAALARLRARALDLGGVLYLPPPGWRPLPGVPPRLTDPASGALATPAWQARSKAAEALRRVVGQRLPLPADLPLEPVAAGKRKPAKDAAPPDPVGIEPLACPGQPPMVCLALGPRQEYAGLLPRFQAGVVEQRTGSLVWLLEGAEPVQAPALLRALGNAPLLLEQP